MFLCEDCLEKEYEIRDNMPLEALPRSYGPCENCGEQKVCYDLPHGTWKKRGNENKEEVRSDTEIEGFHVICGTTPKNGIIFGDNKGKPPLDLSGLNSLLIVDLNHFVEYHDEILEMVEKQIESRDYFKEYLRRTVRDGGGMRKNEYRC